MKYRELAYKIIQHFSGGRVSSQNRLSTRRVVSEINDMRAKVLYDDIVANRGASDFDKQYICVELKEVQDDVCGLGDDVDCTILRSVCPIPRIIGDLIFDISSTDARGKVNFDYVKAGQVKYKLTSRFKGEREGVYVFILNTNGEDYLYVVNADFLQSIKIQAIFSDPIEAIKYSDCREKKIVCSPLDEDIHLNERLMPIVKQYVIEALTPSFAYPQDIVDDDIEHLSTNGGRK